MPTTLANTEEVVRTRRPDLSANALSSTREIPAKRVDQYIHYFRCDAMRVFPVETLSKVAVCLNYTVSLYDLL